MIAEVSRKNSNRSRLKRTSRRILPHRHEAGESVEQRESGESLRYIKSRKEQRFVSKVKMQMRVTVDTASPFERFLNLSPTFFSSFSFPSIPANLRIPNTDNRVCMTSRAYLPGILEQENTRARSERVGGVEGLPLSPSLFLHLLPNQ